MKKIVLSVIMSAFFVIGGLSMMSMTPPPPDNTSCQAYYEQDQWFVEYLGISKGQYISGCNVCLNKGENAANYAVCECKVIDAFYGGLEQYGVTFGECVTTISGNHP